MSQESTKAAWAAVFLTAAGLLVALTNRDFRCAVGLPCPPIVVVVSPSPPAFTVDSPVPPKPGPSDTTPPPVSASGLRTVYHKDVPTALVETLELLTGHGGRIRSVAMAPGGSWVVLHDQGEGVAHDDNAPPDLIRHLQHLLHEGRKPEQVAFTPRGSGWLAIDNTGHLDERGAPADLLEALRGTDTRIRAVSMSSAAWVILEGQGATSRGILPEHLRDLLNPEAVPLISLAMNPSNGFVAVQQDGRWVGENVPESLQRQLQGLDETGCRVELVALSPENGGWVLIATLPSPPPPHS